MTVNVGRHVTDRSRRKVICACVLLRHLQTLDPKIERVKLTNHILKHKITSPTPPILWKRYVLHEYMDFTYQASNDVSISSWEAALYCRSAAPLAQPCYYILTYNPSATLGTTRLTTLLLRWIPPPQQIDVAIWYTINHGGITADYSLLQLSYLCTNVDYYAWHVT